jgi:hypothetical protein
LLGALLFLPLINPDLKVIKKYEFRDFLKIKKIIMYIAPLALGTFFLSVSFGYEFLYSILSSIS